MKISIKPWIGLAAWLAFASIPPALFAAGQVRLPNGDYHEEVQDLTVKVLGGHIAVSRTWQAENVNRSEYRWYINPSWADLRFEFDPVDSSVKTIDRAGSKFERGGNGIYIYDRHFFIARRTAAQHGADGWRWYDRAGNWIDYADNGKILAYGNRNDVSVRFERNEPDGPIRRVLDHRGQLALTLDYSGNRVDSITDRSGNRVQYIYQGNDLVEVVDVRGYRWKYAYSGGRLVEKTDPELRKTTISYGGGRVVRITDPMTFSRTWAYDYNRTRREYTITLKGPEDSRIVKRVFDSGGQLRSEIQGTRETYSRLRDGASVEVETDERGGTTRTTLDANGNVTRTVHPDGSFSTASYDPVYNQPLEQIDENGVRTLREYDAKGNLTKLTEAAGRPEQRVRSFAYDEFGQLETETTEGATDAEDVTVTRDYDDYGNVATLVDGDRNTTRLQYDVRGQVQQRTDARNKVWKSLFDPGGRLLESENPLGEKTVYEYDKVGNLAKTTDPRGKATVSTYYANDLLHTVTGPDGSVQTWTYTKDGKEKTFVDEKGTGFSAEHDSDGRVVRIVDKSGAEKIIEYAPEGGGKITTIRLPGYCDTFKYDQRGRRTVTTRTTPCSGDNRSVKTSSRAYDGKGRVISATDAQGRTTLVGYDGLGREIAITDPTGAVTRSGYDARDNRISQTDPSGRIYAYVFDKSGRLREEATPLGETIRYAYDAAGNLSERSSPRGDRRKFRYDDAGRAIAEEFYESSSNTAVQRIAYEYTARGDLKRYVQSGDTESSAVYDYDDSGQRIAETVTFGSGASAFQKTIAIDHWPNGLKKSITYPGQTTVAYTYNGLNQIESASLPGGGEMRWSDYQWRRATRIEAPGVVTTRAFSGENQPLQHRVQAIGGGTAAAPAGALVLQQAYRYDSVGNLLERGTEDGAFSYTYDNVNRLLSADPPPALVRSTGNPDGLPLENYSYDGAGNRLSSAAQPGDWSYNADNQLLAYGLGTERQVFEYDANGQTAKIDAAVPLALRYDAAGRLREATRGGQSVGRYQYDPFGRRIRKETTQGVTWFQYSDEGVAAEYSASGALQRIYGYLPGERWGRTPLWQARVDGAGWQVYFYHVDLSGLPLRMTDSGGAVVWSLRSDAFGGSETVQAQAGIDNPLRYPGQYRDVETGLNYNWHRNYQPATGRYLEWDPMRQYGDPNPYSYANANPFRFIDPEGLRAFDRCNCNEDVKGSGFWVGGNGSATAVFGGGLLGSLGVLTNVDTGETCFLFKFCLRIGPAIGATAGVALDLTGGPACGNKMHKTESCEVSISAAAVAGGRIKGKIDGSIGVPGIANLCPDGDLGIGADGPGISSKWFKGFEGALLAGGEGGVTYNLCKTWVLGCINTPCACEK